MIMRQTDNKQNTCVKYRVCWMEICTSKEDEAEEGDPQRGVNVK